MGMRSAYTIDKSQQELLNTLSGNLSSYLKENILSPEGIASKWSRYYAKPATDAWWKYVAPGIEDQYAGIRGGFYSTDRARGVGQAASQFFEGQILPSLYQSFTTVDPYYQLSAGLSTQGVIENYWKQDVTTMEKIAQIMSLGSSAVKTAAGVGAAGGIGGLVGGLV